ncbi:GNAT family N-acetyltransferase [Furfurilactobacillus siliginis]|uniref:Acetyltransferase n=1 Tax=Furfurilactobacillus siliginis TaxID=348151 RepID=A0A0R2LBI6_9LACO|nr:GNAT family protein [Furfurilactobacillus siliginis]KRN96029.1 hypothetical protein IV55_GL001710 [Furfurilactobacillus siliginis]GEK29281.1 acetyltransferase [Furfurilactobacillus siliginis]
MTVFFQTKHLQLTEHGSRDTDELAAAQWNSATMQRLADGEIKPWQPATYEFLVGGSRQGDREIYIVHNQAGLAIGWAGLTMIQLKNRGAVIVITVVELPNRAQILTELMDLLIDSAFTGRNLQRLQIAVAADDEALLDAVKHAHFILEGCNRAGLFHAGKRVDCYEYGLLKDEWQANLSEETR